MRYSVWAFDTEVATFRLLNDAIAFKAMYLTKGYDEDEIAIYEQDTKLKRFS